MKQTLNINKLSDCFEAKCSVMSHMMDNWGKKWKA